MPEQTLRQTLAANIRALMARQFGRENVRQLAQKAEVGQATIKRILDLEVDPRTDIVAALAKALQAEAWHLLCPGIDPEHPPRPLPYSPLAVDAARIIDAVTDERQRRVAYAVLVQVAEMGNAPPAPWPAAAPASALAAAEPKPPPLAPARKKPARNR